MHVKSVLSSATALLAGAVVLTACGPGTSPPPAGSSSARPSFASSAPARSERPAPPSPSTARSAAPSAVPSGPASPATTPVPVATPTPAGGTGGTGAGASGGAKGGQGGDATSDTYAYYHPCTSAQLSVRLVRGETATQRLIEVRNLGTRSCGLSYYPRVTLYNGDSATGDPFVEPEVPDGLGGPPATPVYAGRTAYADLDLDPSGDTRHADPMINTMNVLPDGTHMSSRYTRIFRLGAADRVLDPKLGLYETSITAADESLHDVGPTP
ncbi:DUF4232 domain-containing protein [Streptomyces sp. SL13]|uniref:DUF4232 domain-containing protein n=1 Tax=Streptantibioticus silvisoli TaxID=2705255 RepID=A0AA90KFN7_9ACTN|nr:DUF4232 domain-containing protein [Streptantibioticus silvisoli]MDI5969525.1 DUF4232 domain-containing protein [Streptantibioticus silvisoli]